MYRDFTEAASVVYCVIMHNQLLITSEVCSFHMECLRVVVELSTTYVFFCMTVMWVEARIGNVPVHYLTCGTVK